MHPPTSHVKSKSALLAAISPEGISLTFIEGNYLPLFGFAALEGGSCPGANVHQEAEPLEAKVQKTHPIDHMVPAMKNMNAPSSAYSERKNWKIVSVGAVIAV